MVPERSEGQDHWGARVTAVAIRRASVRHRVVPAARHLGPGVFLVPAALYLAVLALYPYVELVRMSLSRVSPENLYQAWPFVGPAQFQAAVATADFQQALLNTFVYVAVVLVSGLVGGLAAALILWQRSPFAAFVLGVIVFVWAMPPIVNGSVWRFLFDQRGLIDSLLVAVHLPPVFWLVTGKLPLVSVALVNAWVAVPFATIVYRAALLDIPPALLEAAAVDGAMPWQIVRHIIVPLLRPVMLVLGVITVVYAFRSFDFIYIMTYGGPGTVSTTLPFLAYRLAFQSYQFSLGAATAVISVVIVLGLALLYIRQVRREEPA
jgi:multiple sugar transport system permease protein